MTVVPNFLVTGVLARLVGLAVLAVAVASLRTGKGDSFWSCSPPRYCVGGGFTPGRTT